MSPSKDGLITDMSPSLGPLLFLLYINDIENCSKKFKFYLFADDTNLLYLEKDLNSLEKIVNEELCHLYTTGLKSLILLFFIHIKRN